MLVPQHPWLNRALKVILQKTVAQVPIAGPFLSDIVSIIWPAPSSPAPTSDELFAQIQAHVSALIDEKTAKHNQGFPGAVVNALGDSNTDDYSLSVANQPLHLCGANVIEIAVDGNINALQVNVAGNSSGEVHFALISQVLCLSEKSYTTSYECSVASA